MNESNEPRPVDPVGEQTNPYATPEAELRPAPGWESATNLVLASRWARLGGAIVDSLIMLPIAFGILLALGAGSGLFRGEGMGLGVQILGGLLTAAAFIAINYHFWEKNGQSIGKLAVGTKIVRTNGERCPASRIITHRVLPITIAQQVPIVGTIIGLVDALLIFRANKKCLHDDIADTIVVRARPAAPPQA